MYFVSHKYAAANAFEKFLAGLRVEGTPSGVVIVESNDGGELMQGKIEKLCRERIIKTRIPNCRQPGVQRSSRAGVDYDSVCSTSR